MKETTLPAPSTFLNKLEIFICEAETFSFQNLSQCGIAPLWRQTYPLTCNEQSLCHPWEFPFSLSFSEREGVFRQRQGNWSVERGTSWNIEDRFFCGSCVGIRMLMVHNLGNYSSASLLHSNSPSHSVSQFGIHEYPKAPFAFISMLCICTYVCF